jgi:uncharacterized membrane protein YeaQ/YmgE (transglycosylase-associated protein family)
MNDFYDRPEWKKLSKTIRNTYQKCLRCSSTDRLCADHIIPRSVRPDLELEVENLQTLCWSCNDFKSNKYIVSFLEQSGPNLSKWLAHEHEKAIANRMEYIARKKRWNWGEYSKTGLTVRILNGSIIGRLTDLLTSKNKLIGIPLMLIFIGLVGAFLPFFVAGLLLLPCVDFALFILNGSTLPEDKIRDMAHNQVSAYFTNW